MRADMFKVIVERPRIGAGHAPSPKLKRTKGQKIRHIGLKRHALTAAPYSKSLNENLAPLVRFLRSRRGQRWDDVFSEICQHLDTGSTVKMHVRQHLDDFVITRISVGRYGEWMCNGRIICEHYFRWHRPKFFVDPTDGILKDYNELSDLLPRINNKINGGAR